MGLFSKKEKNEYVYEVLFNNGDVEAYQRCYFIEGFVRLSNMILEESDLVFIPHGNIQEIKRIQVAGYIKVGKGSGK